MTLLELRKIANELKTNTSLETLNFSNNALGTIGVKTLVNGLIKNTTVQALLLNGLSFPRTCLISRVPIDK